MGDYLQNRHQRFSNFNRDNDESVNKFIDIKLDSFILDLMCRAITTVNPQFKRSHVINIQKLLKKVNPKEYNTDIEKEKKVKFIRKGIEARLDYNLTDKGMILAHINGGILDSSDYDRYPDLNGSELHWLNTMIGESLKYHNTYDSINKVMDVCSRIKNAEYDSKGEVVKEFEGVISDIQNQFRRINASNDSEEDFTLEDGEYENIMHDTYTALSSPGRKLLTGMQAVNNLLGGGFENGRCYLFLGLPGEGKSTILLNLAYQIKKYNKRVQTKDSTKKPCIVLLTMENSITESVSRLFSIATGRDDIIDYDCNDVISMMRKDGELYLSDESPINLIIKYLPSNSADTSVLYTITDDLEDKGYETICFIQDYIGRIHSVDKGSEMRVEYGSVVDEFKTFALNKDIPVITAAQLNRDASRHIDDAKDKARTDLVRVIGRSNVAESILILNNCDAAYVLAPEYVKTENRYYLGLQKIKGRFKGYDLDLAYLPYHSTGKIKLLEDLYATPNYKKTLSSSNDLPCACEMYEPISVGNVDFGSKVTSDPDAEGTNIFHVTQYTEASRPKVNYRSIIEDSLREMTI